MSIKESQKDVEELICHYGDYWEPLSMMARLTEEVGELARVYNIKYGGKKSKFVGDGDGKIEDEMAEVLFTLLAMANQQGVDMGKVLKYKIIKDFDKMKGVYVKNDNTNC